MGTLINGLEPVATANLSINYKKPIKVNQEYMLLCDVVEEQGKKIRLRAKIIDCNNLIHVEATALMIKVKWDANIWKSTLKNILNCAIPLSKTKE